MATALGHKIASICCFTNTRREQGRQLTAAPSSIRTDQVALLQAGHQNPPLNIRELVPLSTSMTVLVRINKQNDPNALDVPEKAQAAAAQQRMHGLDEE